MQNDAPTDTILIVDFGSQVTQLIARRLRDVLVASGAASGEGHAAASVRALATSGADLSPILELLSAETLAISGAEAASSV